METAKPLPANLCSQLPGHPSCDGRDSSSNRFRRTRRIDIREFGHAGQFPTIRLQQLQFQAVDFSLVRDGERCIVHFREKLSPEKDLAGTTHLIDLAASFSCLEDAFCPAPRISRSCNGHDSIDLLQHPSLASPIVVIAAFNGRGRLCEVP